MRKKRRSSPTGTLPKYQPGQPLGGRQSPGSAATTGRRRRASEPSPRSGTAGANNRASTPAHQSAAFRAWLRSYRDVSTALRRRLGTKEGHEDITPLVDAAGGLLVVDDFLPPLAAEGVSSALASLPELAWSATGASENAARNDIDHFFHSTKGQNVTPRQAGEAAAAQAEAAQAAGGAGDEDEEDDEDDGGGARAKRPSRGSNSSSGSGSGSGRGTTTPTTTTTTTPHMPPGLRGLDPQQAAAAAEAAVRLLPPIFRMLSLLCPGALHTFSAARYGPGHCIAPHDDRAYTRVRLHPTGGQEEGAAEEAAAAEEAGAGGGGKKQQQGSKGGGGSAAASEGEIIECSRTLAVIYYASKQWRPDWGGALVDLEPGGGGAAAAPTEETPAAVAAARRAAAAAGVELPPASSARILVPKFNRLVVFRVPRYHQVTPVLPRVGARHRRFSVFGWFLEPGRLYPLYTGAGEEEGGAGGAGARAGGGAGGGGARRAGKGASGRRSVDGPRGRVSRASVATTATDDSGGEGWLQPGSN